MVDEPRPASGLLSLLRRRPLLFFLAAAIGGWFLFPQLRREALTLRISGPKNCPHAMASVDLYQDRVLARGFKVRMDRHGDAEETLKLSQGTYEAKIALVCDEVEASMPQVQPITVDRSGTVELHLGSHCPCR